jgi:hypothetical protein
MDCRVKPGNDNPLVAAWLCVLEEQGSAPFTSPTRGEGKRNSAGSIVITGFVPVIHVFL